MNAVVVFCNALTLCSFVLGRSRPKILKFHWIGIRPVKHQEWKPENCQLFQLGTALDFQSPIFGFEVFFRETSTRLAVGPNFLRYEFVEAPEMPYGGT
jgi:hypothetical protein